MTGTGRAWVSAKRICLPSCSAARSASGWPVRRSRTSEPVDGDPAVGGAGQREDRLAGVDVAWSSAGRPSATPPRTVAVDLAQELDLRVDVDGDALRGGAEPVQQRAERGHLRRRPRRSRARPRRTSAWSGPAPASPRRSSSPARRRRAWPARRGCRAVSGAATTSLRTPEVRGRPASENAWAMAVERVEVGAGLPRRVDRRGERVHERVHVGGGQVVLLVPGRGRQHHVGEQRGGGHPEVQRQQQVELALGRLVAPDARPGAACPAAPRRPAARRRCRAGGAGSTRCPWPRSRAGWPATRSAPAASSAARPDRAQANPSRPSRSASRHAPRPDRPGWRRGPRRRRRAGCGRTSASIGIQPSRADSASRSAVCRPANSPLRQRRGEHVGAVLVVAPLVGVQVPVRGADHLPRRAGPVQPERQVRPAGDRPALLLPDVVRPAAAVDALAAGQRGQRQHRPVGGVGVEPVVRARHP